MKRDLSGTTLQAYLYILRSGKDRIGVRELMREMHMKTPSHAYYHLDKLVSLGLLEKKFGDYYLVKSVKVDYLKDFIYLGNRLIPRFLFYTSFFLVILIFALVYPAINEFYWYITFMLSVVGFAVSLYESIISLKRLR